MAESVSLPDTNTILRYLLKDHPEMSAKATAYWESVREGHVSARLTEGVLMECVYVLQRFYKVPREPLADQLAMILAYKGLRHQDLAIFGRALEIYRQGSLDFVDCLLVARELSGEGRVFSFDQGIGKALATERK
jgi:predicted nucleic-acid-binding protein